MVPMELNDDAPRVRPRHWTSTHAPKGTSPKWQNLIFILAYLARSEKHSHTSAVGCYTGHWIQCGCIGNVDENWGGHISTCVLLSTLTSSPLTTKYLPLPHLPTPHHCLPPPPIYPYQFVWTVLDHLTFFYVEHNLMWIYNWGGPLEFVFTEISVWWFQIG